MHWYACCFSIAALGSDESSVSTAASPKYEPIKLSHGLRDHTISQKPPFTHIMIGIACVLTSSAEPRLRARNATPNAQKTEFCSSTQTSSFPRHQTQMQTDPDETGPLPCNWRISIPQHTTRWCISERWLEVTCAVGRSHRHPTAHVERSRCSWSARLHHSLERKHQYRRTDQHRPNSAQN